MRRYISPRTNAEDQDKTHKATQQKSSQTLLNLLRSVNHMSTTGNTAQAASIGTSLRLTANKYTSSRRNANDKAVLPAVLVRSLVDVRSLRVRGSALESITSYHFTSTYSTPNSHAGGNTIPLVRTSNPVRGYHSGGGEWRSAIEREGSKQMAQRTVPR